MTFNREHLTPWLSLKSWRPYFLIFVIGFLLYSQTLFFDFTYLDDQELIINNAAVLQNVKNFGSLFTTDVFFSAVNADKFYYRPLLNASFMLDAQVGGGIVTAIFHLDNILIHLLAAILIFYLLCRLTSRRPLSFWLALIFLAHPVLVQAVAWLPGRNDSLLTVFVLAAFIAVLDFLRTPRLRSYLAYLLLFLAALLTKETAIGLPLVVIFYFLFIDRGAASRTDRWLLVIGSAAVGFIWFLARHFALGGETIGYLAAWESLWPNAPALLVHLGKLVFPISLPVFPVLADSTLVYGWLVLAALALAWFLSRQKRNRYFLFGAFWFLIFLLPSFIRLTGLPDFLEHRLYLSFFGFLIMLAEIDWIKNMDFSRRLVKICAVAVLVILAGITLVHSRSFSDRLTFWQEASAGSPHSPLAQRNLAVMYYFDGNAAAATMYDAKALALNPQEPMVHNNLGVIYMDQNNLALAEQEFRAELAVNPGYDKALFNLGDLFSRRGQDAVAAQWFAAALQADPGYYDAYQRLLILQKRLK